jgi:methylenetetrahydrofolate--tRNA-(uracil-5-)-methyltransferase
LFFAGQITGVEGYLGNIATGALAGINAARQSQGLPSWSLPVTTMLGALVHYVTHADPAHFQPMKANFGILPPLEGPPLSGRRARASAHAARSTRALKAFLNRETAHSH